MTQQGTGRVVRVDRGAATVAGDAGECCRVLVPPVTDSPVVGDYVTFDGDLLTGVQPRRSQLVRATAGRESKAQPLAANVDTALVVVPAFPQPRAGMIERLVALVWDGGVTPVIVMTKADLAFDPSGTAADLRQAAPGAEVLVVSALTGEGLEAVRRYDQPGHTVCLLGRSGAGKSTLANALMGTERFVVREVRRDGKGRHTTTHRELVELPGGGNLIDTPGLRGVGMWLGEDGMAQAFPDIDELLGTCRFTNCSHTSEPDCAVTAAVADGVISERRLASWRKLHSEAEWMAARFDRRVAEQRARRWRQLAKQSRAARP